MAAALPTAGTRHRSITYRSQARNPGRAGAARVPAHRALEGRRHVDQAVAEGALGVGQRKRAARHYTLSLRQRIWVRSRPTAAAGGLRRAPHAVPRMAGASRGRAAAAATPSHRRASGRRREVIWRVTFTGKEAAGRYTMGTDRNRHIIITDTASSGRPVLVVRMALGAVADSAAELLSADAFEHFLPFNMGWSARRGPEHQRPAPMLNQLGALRSHTVPVKRRGRGTGRSRMRRLVQGDHHRRRDARAAGGRVPQTREGNLRAASAAHMRATSVGTLLVASRGVRVSA